MSSVPPLDENVEKNARSKSDDCDCSAPSPHSCVLHSVPNTVLTPGSSEKQFPKENYSFHEPEIPEEPHQEKDQEGEEKSANVTQTTHEPSGQNPARTPNLYLSLLMIHNKELQRVQEEYERYTGERGDVRSHAMSSNQPRRVDLELGEGVKLEPYSPSMLFLKARGSFQEEEKEESEEEEEEEEKEKMKKKGDDVNSKISLPSPSSSVGSVATAAAGEGGEQSQPSSFSQAQRASESIPHDKRKRRTLEEYKNWLQQRRDELDKTAAEYQKYAMLLAKFLGHPPVTIPSHLVNSFEDTNVLEARDHKGRMDLVVQPPNPFNTGQSRGDDEESIDILELQRACESDAELRPPRFTIHSLPNGDLLERDACNGWRYWDAEEPVVRKQVMPSKLLDERIEEAFHNYRFYSHRWAAQLKALASSVGGEEGAELLRRYETRESSLPLPLSCRRDFFESIVDYDTLLREQDRLLQAAGQKLEDYHADLLDGPV